MVNIIHICFGMFLASVVHGHICCVPQKWEGFMYGGGDFLRPFSGEADKVSYDADSKKIAVAGVSVRDDITTEFKVIDDYSNNKRYVIKPESEVCVTTSISGEFPKLCVPDDATERGTLYVGFGEKKLDVTVYTFPVKKDLFDTKVFMVVTGTGCIPIFSDARGTYNSTDYIEILNYNTITDDISDDTVFDPPTYCSETILDDENPRRNSFLKF